MTKSFSFLLLITFFNLFYYLFFSYDKEISNSTIVIQQGMKIHEISKMLYEKKIIRNKSAFNLWIKLNFLEKKIKFGEFQLSGKNSIYNITKKLLSGTFVYRKFTLVEGMYKYELLKILKQIDPNSVVSIYDIPDNIIADTYSYLATDTAERILENVINYSQRFSKDIWEKRDQNIPIKNIDELYILASIVEKETAIKSEKGKIAGVFFNRMSIGMRLQSDPTVEFSITKGVKKLGRKLLRKDLKFDSEYNTYMNKGLPPSIICYPGKESLIAVSRPYNSNYLFFVAKNKNGQHYFSVNYKEHLERIRSIKNAK